ncbi:pyridoxamine 5'-phosphate oxidase family protein [Nostocoides vanveenii]|jgi:nitroimidazol reductase NimA-like FMN-containing flavoprotein (pyridoxamine 5'-phosphate oxidase superfamily)|uniref:Pyridoxamine 5'-phosphate oxidase family protein n=1 Tax=Nostocoides vanveenii TaxID=330835 RepID=A0ABP4WEE5_9MICO
MLDDNPVTDLTQDQCWDFLGQHEFGRLAFHLAGEVHITPVNYVVDGQRLIFRTAEGNKLLGVTMNNDVAFEADEFTDTEATSVVLRGSAETLEGDEADAVDHLPLRPWVATTKLVVVAITVSEMSGRRFALHKPWAHMRSQ